MHIVVDIGGTNTRVAASSDDAAFNEPRIFPTSQTYGEGVGALIQAAKECASGEAITAIAVGAAGVIAPDRRSLITKGNLPDWKGKPLADDIERALGGTLFLENDTALCGLGEAHFGAGKGASVVVYMTVSTGVGATRIVRGFIDDPERSAEIGHEYINIGDKLQEFEDVVSGTAISKRFGKHPKELGKDNPVWEELAAQVAVGLHNSILHWTPDKVILGGSMFNEIGIPVARVAFHLKKILTALPEVPEIVHSELGDVGGLWGGLALLSQKNI